MKTYKLIFFIATFILFLSGCDNKNNNGTVIDPPVMNPPVIDPPVVNPPVAENTEFYNNVVAAFNQNEDDEPLEVTETVDETSNFDALL